jgi:hypothetical protein
MMSAERSVLRGAICAVRRRAVATMPKNLRTGQRHYRQHLDRQLHGRCLFLTNEPGDAARGVRIRKIGEERIPGEIRIAENAAAAREIVARDLRLGGMYRVRGFASTKRRTFLRDAAAGRHLRATRPSFSTAQQPARACNRHAFRRSVMEPDHRRGDCCAPARTSRRPPRRLTHLDRNNASINFQRCRIVLPRSTALQLIS